MSEVIGRSAAGTIEKVENLKKRQRAVYYRPIKNEDGEVIDWIQTELLPSDSQGRELYFSKGFRLSPPAPTDETQEVDSEKEALLAENQRLRELLEQPPEAPKRKVARKKKSK